jgi:hypothetical protein
MKRSAVVTTTVGAREPTSLSSVSFKSDTAHQRHARWMLTVGLGRPQKPKSNGSSRAWNALASASRSSSGFPSTTPHADTRR